MSRPHSNDFLANYYSAGESQEDAVVRNFRLTAAEGERITGQVMRKFGIPEFPAKPAEAEKPLVEVEAELKGIEAARIKKGKS